MILSVLHGLGGVDRRAVSDRVSGDVRNHIRIDPGRGKKCSGESFFCLYELAFESWSGRASGTARWAAICMRLSNGAGGTYRVAQVLVIAHVPGITIAPSYVVHSEPAVRTWSCMCVTVD
jgi:hypothetical protein